MNLIDARFEITFDRITVDRFFPGDRLQPADGPIFEFRNVRFFGIKLENLPENIQNGINERLNEYSETLDYKEYLIK